jgi:hypothetical protein
MKNYKVPVLVKVKAESRDEAEQKASRYLSAAGLATHENEPKLHESIVYWTLAELRAKK